MIEAKYTYRCDACGAVIAEPFMSVAPYVGVMPRPPVFGFCVGHLHVCSACFDVAVLAVRRHAAAAPLDTAIKAVRAMTKDQGAVFATPTRNLDAERYSWLRAQFWDTGKFAVVMNPRASLQLGAYCPSLEKLDAAIDGEMAKEKQPCK